VGRGPGVGYEKLFGVWAPRRWVGMGSEMIGRQAGVVCEDFITQFQLLDLSPGR